MAVCQFCGCKTDELDFVDVRIGGLDKKACSFCRRQLKNFDGDNISDAQIKWLLAVINKAVPDREEDVLDALKELLEKNGGASEATAPQEPYAAEVKHYKAQSSKAQVTSDDGDKDRLIAELTTRVDKLEKTIIMMKRTQLIKLVCEIAIPVILGIIILIIFFSSGFYNTLSGLYSSFG